MALISAVGRRSLRTRTIYFVLYFLLSLGAVTTIYPFLIMIGVSLQSQYEQGTYAIVPEYLKHMSPLFGKYAEAKYDADINRINAQYGTHYVKFRDVVPPATMDINTLKVWDQFVAGLPMRLKDPGFSGAAASYSPSPLASRYQTWLNNRFNGDIQRLDRAYTEEDESFLTVFPPYHDPTKHTWALDSGQKGKDWLEFLRTLPANYFQVVRADPPFRKWLKEEAGYANVGALNSAWHTNFPSMDSITLSARPTGSAPERKDWETFVRRKLSFQQVALSSAALPAFQAYSRNAYRKSVDQYNKVHHQQITSFNQVGLIPVEAIPSTGAELLDRIGFVKSAAALDMISVDSSETRFRNLLAQKGVSSATEAIVLPARAADWQYVNENHAGLRRELALQNYALVVQYIALHGRGVVNTILFCLLSILTAVIVNPLCAYSLSRYNLSFGNSVLLFLLATMAFPAEVAMIPNFLLLKQLGLLNTFAALVLPGAANGFSIFLLKGFFDNLPRELYEAGTLDGASEARMFWQIALPLSKPIFAVIALSAYMAAYSAFIFAMVVCQDQKMWTLMVWLYELQSSGAPSYVYMAGLTLAAIPTIVIFLFAQKTIMRGIILPSFK